MCLAKAYIDEKKEPIMEDIALVKLTGDKLQLSTLFGEQKEISASVKTIDFQSGSIVLEASETTAG